MKKVFAVFLALVMALGICACADKTNGDAAVGNADNPDTRNTIDAGAMVLTEIGTVPDGVSFTSGGIISTHNGDKVQVLNQNGVSFNDKLYDDVSAIICNGICVVSNKNDAGKTLLGIVDTIREKELLPCEVVDVRVLSDRFVFLGYETEEGTADDRFGTYYVKGTGIDYKGYAKVFDLEKGQIVPGVEITTSQYDVAATGNVIFVETDYRCVDVYSADGKLIGNYEYLYAYPESAIALQSTKEGVCVYDKDMKLVTTLETTDYSDKYQAIDGTSEMLLHSYGVVEGNVVVTRYCVTDLYGKALSAEFDRILKVYPDGYLYVDEGGISRIVDFQGKIIVPDFSTVRYVKLGYFVANVSGEGYYVYDTTGKKINDTAMADGSSGIIVQNKAGKLFVFETGELLAADGYAKEQTGSLVLIENTLYDVISGKTVMEDVDACVATGGNLYVWDSETKVYTRYKAEFKSQTGNDFKLVE